MAVKLPTLPSRVGLIIGVANKRSLAWSIAQAVSLEGASLAFTYQNERLRENVEKLAGGLADPLVLPCDLNDDAQIDAVFTAIEEKYHGLDFVVHSAAFAEREALSKPFSETSRDAFRTSLEVSAYSLVAVARRAAPLLAKSPSARILTLSFLGSERVFPNYNVMGVAKAALESSVRYLASEFGPRGIRVNAISAGPVKTLAASGVSGFSDFLKTYEQRAPIGRNITAADVAEAALFLLGPAGRAITGQVIMVDGGYSIMGV
ncbi:MAG: enoyl-ACP reductase [Vicinamibacterales bacterium]